MSVVPAPQVPVEAAEEREVDDGGMIPAGSGLHVPWWATDFEDAELWAGHVLRLAPSVVVPARAFASGVLDQMGGVGPRAIPLSIGQPIKAAVDAGEPVLCWITDQPIGRLNMDHVIPYSYGGATNAANLLPAEALANQQRSNKLDLLVERKIGWKWDVDQYGRQVRVPDTSQRLIRVVTVEGDVYFSVPKFDVGEFAGGAAVAAGFAVVIEGALQWRAGEFQPVNIAEEAAKAAAGYSARYSAKIAVQALAPRALPLIGSAGVEMLGSFAGPVGFVAAIYGAEAIEQGVALARGKVTPSKAAKNFVLAPVGAVKDTAGLAVYGYKLISPKHRAVRKNQQKWRSIHFVPDLKRPDPRRWAAA